MGEKIGILGGSFNPMHRGHLDICIKLHEYFRLDRVVLLPNHTPPHKSGLQLDYEGRVQLIAQAIDGYPYMEISLFEQDRRPHFTYHTLRSLRHHHPEAELFFAMGMDSLLTLPQWHNGLQLTEFAHLAVFSRHGHDLAAAPAALREYLQGRTVAFTRPARIPHPIPAQPAAHEAHHAPQADPAAHAGLHAAHGGRPNRGQVFLIGEYPPEVSATQVRRLLDDYYALKSEQALSLLYGLLGNRVMETIMREGYYRR